MAREMKDSGVQWIGKMPENWSITRGKNILNLLNRKIEENSGVVTCFRDGEVTLRKNRRTEGFTNALKEIGYQGVEPGDLVVHGMDGFAGAIGISDSHGKMSPIINVLDSNQNKKYIMYYLRSMAFGNVFLATATGIRERSCDLRWNKLANLEYPLPPLSEQQKIADFLDEKVKEIDNAIEKTKETIELYKKMKKAVIEDYIFKKHEKNVIDTEISYIGKIPAHWKITRVKYVLSENGLKTKGGLEEPLSVSQKYGLIPTKNMDSVPLQMADYSKCKIVHKNDLVFNKLKAHLGVFFHSDYEGIVSPDYAVYQSSNINVEFLELLFKTKEYISEFIKRSTGVGQGFMRLYTEPLFSMYIPYPSIKEQKEIVNSIRQKHKEIDNLISAKQKIINKLELYKKSLIYEYVTGKKEVK